MPQEILHFAEPHYQQMTNLKNLILSFFQIYFYVTGKNFFVSKERNELDVIVVNPLSANFTKWSNTLKHFVGNLPTNCLSAFDHFVKLAL